MIRRHGLWFSLGSLAALVASACGGEGMDDYAALDAPTNVIAPPVRYGPCTEGHTAWCQRIIGRHAGITSCFDGLRTCVDGEWSECQPSTDSSQPESPAPATPQEIP